MLAEDIVRSLTGWLPMLHDRGKQVVGRHASRWHRLHVAWKELRHGTSCTRIQQAFQHGSGMWIPVCDCFVMLLIECGKLRQQYGKGLPDEKVFVLLSRADGVDQVPVVLLMVPDATKCSGWRKLRSKMLVRETS